MERTIDMTTSMAESTGGGMPSWAWIPIILGVAAVAGLIAYFMCCGGEKAPKKKKKKFKRTVKAEPEAVPAASATASTVREEVTQPLIAPVSAVAEPIATTRAPMVQYATAPMAVGAPPIYSGVQQILPMQTTQIYA